jgi:hypothetical protein
LIEKIFPKKIRLFNSQLLTYKLKGVTLDNVNVSYFVKLPSEMIASKCLMHIDPNGDPKTQAKQHVANLINTDVKNVTILSIEMIMKTL